jgi:hypothetical protein
LDHLRADGTAYGASTALGFGPAGVIQATSSGSVVDSTGVGRYENTPGIWTLDSMFRDSPIYSYPMSEPYFLAHGTVAISPNLGEDEIPAFTAQWAEAASVKILVRDGDGKPIRAVVEINRSRTSMMMAGPTVASGATDEEGSIVFKGLSTGDYDARSFTLPPAP